jgi:hypothetical protein
METTISYKVLLKPYLLHESVSGIVIAQLARYKFASMWVYHGAPSIFFTVPPCDECTIK